MLLPLLLLAQILPGTGSIEFNFDADRLEIEDDDNGEAKFYENPVFSFSFQELPLSNAMGFGNRDVDDVLASFNHIILMHPLPSIVHFSRFLSALVRMKQYHTVLSLSRTIESLGISHNVHSLNILINCFCRLHLVDFGFSIFGKILKIGMDPDIVTFNTLINGLCIEGKINGAVDFFNDMVARGGLVSNAQSIIKIMIQAGVEPDAVSYNSLMDGYCLRSQLDEAIQIFDLMVHNGIVDAFSYNILINGYCKSKRIDEAMQLFDEMTQKGFLPDTITYTTLIQGLWNAGKPGTAHVLFKNMFSHGNQPDIITFSTFLDGLCKQGNIGEALMLFNAMEQSKLKIGHMCYNILINGLCRAGKLNDAKEFFSRLFEKGLQPEVYTYGAIIKGLCKEGLLDEAYKVFRGMEDGGCSPNGCCYNVIIQGFLRHGDVPKASQLIEEMVGKGFSADATTTKLQSAIELREEIKQSAIDTRKIILEEFRSLFGANLAEKAKGNQHGGNEEAGTSMATLGGRGILPVPRENITTVIPNTAAFSSNSVAFQGTAAPSSPYSVELQSLLDEYHGIFEDPKGLPPFRSHNHSIPLAPSALPVNIRPYRSLISAEMKIEGETQRKMAKGLRRKISCSNSWFTAKQRGDSVMNGACTWAEAEKADGW
ncbi:hypothetical protein GH714_000416 [Hevea brasiliensis]|uniref:Uncharacterized protein n=1 Tax=Hevea brasiliensis TaxID=3981 RepID=A0A6A6M5V0_HEVBR|nr:hypothetical protein GH714_000416 [Hevea brasiliensis]